MFLNFYIWPKNLLKVKISVLFEPSIYRHANVCLYQNKQYCLYTVILIESEYKLVQVFEAVVRWVRFEVETRSLFMATLLEHVRLPLMPSGYLVEVGCNKKLFVFFIINDSFVSLVMSCCFVVKSL